VFRRRRERKAFRAEMAAAVAAVRPDVEAAVAEAQAVLDETASELASIPGAAARCPHCQGRMQLRPVQKGRHWWTLWCCDACRRTYRPADVPEQTRAAGWR
jgi:hypothetical protein